jgi:hypothetical protein
VPQQWEARQGEPADEDVPSVPTKRTKRAETQQGLPGTYDKE